MTTTTSDQILERVRGGEIDAYAEIVRDHQSDVRRVVACALRDIAASEELVQQVFIDAYLQLDRFEAGRDLGAWLRGIARNKVREELRRRGREDRRMEAYRHHLEARLADDEAAERHDDDLRTALLACREGLTEPTRRALDLRYEKAMAFAEIADAIDRTVAATRQLLQRARLSLRECIEGRLAQS